MRIKHAILTIGLVFLGSGCYAEMTGTVVDTETGKPVEDAVVLIEWTKTKGVTGMTHTESFKVIEVVTDKEGKFAVSGVFDPLVNPPHVTVYKKGYVAWNNEYIFPGYKKRADFKWQSGHVFKLEQFKENYSFIDHESFIDGVAYLFTKTEEKELFIRAYDQWEREKVIKERQMRDSLKKGNQK